jgi:hypothetical protein
MKRSGYYILVSTYVPTCTYVDSMYVPTCILLVSREVGTGRRVLKRVVRAMLQLQYHISKTSKLHRALYLTAAVDVQAIGAKIPVPSP